MKNRQNKTNDIMQKVHQNDENHFSYHKLQSKDPTSQSEESRV